MVAKNRLSTLSTKRQATEDLDAEPAGTRATSSALRLRRWEQIYIRRLLLTDHLLIALSVLAGQLAWFGPDLSVALKLNASSEQNFTSSYTTFSVVIVLIWAIALVVNDSRSPKVIGSGIEEYRAVALATMQVFGLVAIAMYLLKWELGRGYFLTTLPVGLLLLLISRWAWRQWVYGQRKRGLCVSNALLVGASSKNEHVARSIARGYLVGIRPIGALVGDSSAHIFSQPGDLPVLGGFEDFERVINEEPIDVVVVTGADALGPEKLRSIGWILADKQIDLIVAPALTDVAGQRVHARPVAGLPLVHVEHPSLEGRNRFLKRAFDIVGSVALIVLAILPMIVIGTVVKLSSAGPIFYRQERIGLGGVPFGMFKFRTMIKGADDRLKSLLDAQGNSREPLFKIRDDPRITPAGRFLRKYSLDELPQFLNVLIGNMSLIGPRPQVKAEVELYDDVAHRRLRVKPGITGLWQVSGRSSLGWQDALRLDLYYIENWSLIGDLVILLKTFRAVALPGKDAL